MTYFVIEIQTDKEGQGATNVTAFNNQAEAESKYHTVLSVAAVSKLPVHAAVILRSDGSTIARQSYEHVEE